MAISGEKLKRRLSKTGRELGGGLRRAGQQAREAVSGVDVEELRRRLGAVEDRLNRQLDDLSQRARRGLDRWLKRGGGGSGDAEQG